MTHPIASRRTFLKLSAALAGTALLPETGAFAAGGGDGGHPVEVKPPM